LSNLSTLVTNTGFRPGRAARVLVSGVEAGTVGEVAPAVLDALNVEWKNKINSAAPLACDKQIGRGSFQSNKHWEGNVVWGDTHVTFESGQTTASWPTTTVNGHTTVHDNLFTGATGPKATDAVLINP
jgi:hypothetical protein